MTEPSDYTKRRAEEWVGEWLGECWCDTLDGREECDRCVQQEDLQRLIDEVREEQHRTTASALEVQMDGMDDVAMLDCLCYTHAGERCAVTRDAPPPEPQSEEPGE